MLVLSLWDPERFFQFPIIGFSWEEPLESSLLQEGEDVCEGRWKMVVRGAGCSGFLDRHGLALPELLISWLGQPVTS